MLSTLCVYPIDYRVYDWHLILNSQIFLIWLYNNNLFGNLTLSGKWQNKNEVTKCLDICSCHISTNQHISYTKRKISIKFYEDYMAFCAHIRV